MDPDFIKKHPLDPSKKIFYSGDYGKARNENEVHLNGVLYIRRDDFWGILGEFEEFRRPPWLTKSFPPFLCLSSVPFFEVDRDIVSYLAFRFSPLPKKKKATMSAFRLTDGMMRTSTYA